MCFHADVLLPERGSNSRYMTNFSRGIVRNADIAFSSGVLGDVLICDLLTGTSENKL
jgi:hypothetical protein